MEKKSDTMAVSSHARALAAAAAASMQLWEIRGGSTNMVYWSRDEITNLAASAVAACRTNCMAAVEAVSNAMPDRAWSLYQSASGEANPDPANATVITTPSLMMTGGGEWESYIEAGNAVYLLQTGGAGGSVAGAPSPELLAALPPTVRGERLTRLSLPGEWLNTHGKKHLGKKDGKGANLTLNESDYDLIPLMWRDPDFVVADAAHPDSMLIGLDAMDGGVLELGVDYEHGCRPTTFRKRKK